LQHRRFSRSIEKPPKLNVAGSSPVTRFSSSPENDCSSGNHLTRRPLAACQWLSVHDRSWPQSTRCVARDPDSRDGGGLEKRQYWLPASRSVLRLELYHRTKLASASNAKSGTRSVTQGVHGTAQTRRGLMQRLIAASRPPRTGRRLDQCWPERGRQPWPGPPAGDQRDLGAAHPRGRPAEPRHR